MVGTNGLEPSTSRLSGVRSNHLSYRPIYQRVISENQIVISEFVLIKCFRTTDLALCLSFSQTLAP